MTIETQLFFEMLHNARYLKRLGIPQATRRQLLPCMLRHFVEHMEDSDISANMKDYWMHQRCGAE